jgi:hypothetical protein
MPGGIGISVDYKIWWEVVDHHPRGKRLMPLTAQPIDEQGDGPATRVMLKADPIMTIDKLT